MKTGSIKCRGEISKLSFQRTEKPMKFWIDFFLQNNSSKSANYAIFSLSQQVNYFESYRVGELLPVVSSDDTVAIARIKTNLKKRGETFHKLIFFHWPLLDSISSRSSISDHESKGISTKFQLAITIITSDTNKENDKQPDLVFDIKI